jgi:NAD/NADP transhydrogenase beta subunit
MSEGDTTITTKGEGMIGMTIVVVATINEVVAVRVDMTVVVTTVGSVVAGNAAEAENVTLGRRPRGISWKRFVVRNKKRA